MRLCSSKRTNSLLRWYLQRLPEVRPVPDEVVDFPNELDRDDQMIGFD